MAVQVQRHANLAVTEQVHDRARLWRQGWCEVHRAFRIGAFVIAPDVHRAIRRIAECDRKIDEADFFSRVDAELMAVMNGIEEIRELARRDLGVAGWWPRPKQRGRPK